MNEECAKEFGRVFNNNQNYLKIKKRLELCFARAFQSLFTGWFLFAILG